MTRYQINQLNMLEGIALFLQTYAERLSGNPKVAALAAILAVIIQNIRDAKQIQDKTTEAESKIKMDLQEKILQELHNIGIALRAYAGGGVDPVVYAVGNYKDWEIEHLRNSDLADKAREVFETAKPIIEKLSSAVTEDIASLDVNYKAYMKARPDIGVTEAKSETATATIDSKIREGKKLLNERLDEQMALFELTDKEVYQIYQNLRKIDDLPGTHKKKGGGGTPA